MLAALLMFLLAAFVGVLAIGMIFAIAGIVFSIAFGVAGFLLFKVAPVLLLGWIVVKLVQRGSRHDREISAADQRWLDS
jgi:predicted membrane channel-forming protein YqfA (hemolysin III family)